MQAGSGDGDVGLCEHRGGAVMASVKDTLHAAASFALIFILGGLAGLFVGHPEPYVLGTMTNSSVNMTPDSGVGPSNCASYGSEVRCVFVGENETWACVKKWSGEFCSSTGGEP